MPRFPVLDGAQLEAVALRQAEQRRAWRAAPPEGYLVECAGRDFVVLANVFPPRRDTRLLAEQLQVPEGAAVLDMGTGCGVLAVLAALGGAGRALALDINPAAVANAELNIAGYGLGGRVQARYSDGFAAVGPEDRFDLIVANLPGRAASAADLVEAAHWDTGFRTHRGFFAGAPRHLAPGGRILMAKANYPELNQVAELAEAAGFTVDVLATQAPEDDDPRTYYALAFAR